MHMHGQFLWCKEHKECERAAETNTVRCWQAGDDSWQERDECYFEPRKFLQHLLFNFFGLDQEHHCHRSLFLLIHIIKGELCVGISEKSRSPPLGAHVPLFSYCTVQ